MGTVSTTRGEPRRGHLLRCALITALAALSWMVASDARAQTMVDAKSYTRATYQEWLEKYRDAVPDFKPGDVLTAKDLERMRPFVPPGYLPMLNFPEFRAKIVAPGNHTPRKDYMECTEKYQNQVRLASDGAPENFVCGQPFALSALDIADPMSGYKVAWNYDWRWQNYGVSVHNLYWIWMRDDGGRHAPPAAVEPPIEWDTMPPLLGEKPPGDLNDYFGGTGSFQRTLQGPYKRIYFSHLPQIPDHVLPLPGAADFEFKELTSFSEPFDIRGTAFIVYRYADPHRADDAWAYVPTLRRVRRISAEVKSDSLLGTDHTLEDFYFFSGRPLEWKWKFWGYKNILAVTDPKAMYTAWYGHNGVVPKNDEWSVIKMAVVERFPTNPRHPYSSVVGFLDPVDWACTYSMAFDKKLKLWKEWQWLYQWTEDVTGPWSEYNHGCFCQRWHNINVEDIQNDRGTIVGHWGVGVPDIDKSASNIMKWYDVAHLEQAHR